MSGHLIHIGFPKAGSTSLQEWFRRHPELVFKPGRLGGYDYLWNMVAQSAQDSGQDLRWHVSSLESLVVPPPSNFRDFRTLGSLSARRDHLCRTLQAISGGATILIVTRGFKGLLASFYSLYVRNGGVRSLKGMLAELEPVLTTAFDYDAVVRLYGDAFGPANVLVLPYELLRDDPAQFLGILQQQLGLELASEPIPHLNRSLSPAELYWYPAFSRLADRVSRRLGRRNDRAFDFYRERITGPDLRRTIEVLSRAAPALAVHAEREVPPAAVERFRNRAASLAALPAYAGYHAEYLNDGI